PLVAQGRASVLSTADMPHQELFDGVATQGATADARKHGVVLRAKILSKPGGQDSGRLPAERGAALLAPLALAAHVRAVAADDILAAQVDQLGHPQPGLDGD